MGKVRMQALPSTATSSTFSMLRSTAAKEGIRGLYRGVSAPLCAIAPVFAVCFWGYDMGKRIVMTGTGTVEELTILQICLAGGFSAIPTTAIMAPSERIKCLLQIQQQGQVKKYSGMMDCLVKVYREGGIQSVYKGTGATLLRDIPASIAYFGTYELVKKEMTRYQGIPTSQLSTSAVLLAGGLAGMVNWCVCIGPDTLKSRYQTAPEGTYRNLWHVYKELVRNEGHSALFRGLGPALIRAFPANAACFYGMEVSKTL